MQTNQLFSVLLMSTFIFIGSSFKLKYDHSTLKYFEVSTIGEDISKEKKLVLLKAYKAQFGAKSKIETVEFVGTDDLWLVFQSGGDGTKTFAIQTKTINGKIVIEANSATNTCTGNPCSWCYYDSNNGCICNSDKSSMCNHTQTSLMDHRIFASNLGF